MRDNLIATGAGGQFTRPPSEFTGTVEPPDTAGAKHVAEAGRYHLFVSGVCPRRSLTRTRSLTLTLIPPLTLTLSRSARGPRASAARVTSWDCRHTLAHALARALALARTPALSLARASSPWTWPMGRAAEAGPS